MCVQGTWGGLCGVLLITVCIFSRKCILGNEKIRWTLLGEGRYLTYVLDKLSYQLAELTAVTC